MKQTVTDIQDIRAALDEEDEQLMRMFPRKREAALDEMLLVQKDGEMYLIRKEDVARNRKILNGVFCAVTTARIPAPPAGNGSPRRGFSRHLTRSFRTRKAAWMAL